MKANLQIRELTPEYVWKEYGVTRRQLEAAVRRTACEIAADRKAGKLKKFAGKLTPKAQREKHAEELI